MTPLAGSPEAPGVRRPPPAAGPAAQPAAPLDETGESVRDTAATSSEALTRRAEAFLLATAVRRQALSARLDRMRADFNAAEEERSERLRELNMLRDMAIEQAKHDDEILKKFIAMI
jgi:hypothetical protein